MALQYVGLSEINGPLVVLDHVKNASYDEMVEFVLQNGSKKSRKHLPMQERREIFLSPR